MMDQPAGQPTEALPERLPVLPMRGTVLFPFTAAPLTMGQERSVRLVDAVMRGDRLLTVVAQRDAQVENPGPEDCYTVGTAARIAQMARGQEGELMVLVQGLARVRITEYEQVEPYLVGRIQPAPELADPSAGQQGPSTNSGQALETQALQRNVVAQFQRLVSLANMPAEMAAAVSQLEDPLQTAYIVASATRLDLPIRQELLELDSVSEKLRSLSAALGRELEIMEIGRRLQQEAQQEMSKTQREYFLREQLRAIQRELGEEDPSQSEVADLRRRLDEAGLPEAARSEANRELSRLEAIPQASPERGMIRTYLEWMADLPWSKSTGGAIDVQVARRVLDEDHHDLDKVKERILEYLAVRKLKQERGILEVSAAGGQSGDAEGTAGEGDAPLPITGADEALREPILCIVGPPGVGKTSLGQSIARAMKRKFVRMSLGGIRDEAEIRGHRRTYIGAMPGRIIQGLRRVGANDPVFMLDEVDKLALGFQGDPAAALLEVLDPAQNHTFEDNYLGVPFDLSRVLFIGTANTMGTIPPALIDRMEILEIPGYAEEEKTLIAARYLVPRQRRANGLRDDEVVFEEAALRRIIGDYTREAGVRDLERQIATICRKVARDLAMSPEPSPPPAAEPPLRRRAEEGTEGVSSSSTLGTKRPVIITAETVEEMLGRPRFFAETAERVDRPGVATGLAWTPVGGDMLFVEAAIMPAQDERLILTGMLGDVMRESAQAALTYLQSNAVRLGIDPAALTGKAIHIHVPAGAIPKDGPSAGVTMLTALASAATGRPVRHDLAMTGEITLRGKVLPVGGIKEKVLAAHRGGIRVVMLPRQNERDLEGVPEELQREVRIVPIDTAEEVLAEAIGLAPEEIAARRRAAAAAAAASRQPTAARSGETA